MKRFIIFFMLILFSWMSFGQSFHIGIIASKSGTTQTPNIVSNGTFDDGTDWVTQTGWEISGGTLNGTSTTALTSQANPTLRPVANATYDFQFDVIEWTTGRIRIRVGGTSPTAVVISGAGTYYGDVVSGSDGFVRVDDGGAGGAFTGKLDNLEVRVVSDTNTDYPSGDAMTPNSDGNSTGSWYGSSSRVTVSVNSTDYADGDYSLELENTYQSGSSVRAEWDFNLEDNATYNITFWAKKISGTEAAFTAWTGFDSFSGKDITNTEWAEYKWTGLVANGTVQKIRAYPSSSSGNALLGDTILIDRLVIEKQ